MGGKCRDGVVAAVPKQVFGEPSLLFWYRRISLELFGVYYGEVEAGFSAMVQEDGVEDFSTGFRQSKGYIAYAEHGLHERQFLFDQADPLNRFDRAAHIVFIAGSARKDERIDDYIFSSNAVALSQQVDRPLGDSQLTLAGDRLGLMFVFVNAPHDQGRAVLSGKGRDALEFLESVFEVDRVDD